MDFISITLTNGTTYNNVYSIDKQRMGDKSICWGCKTRFKMGDTGFSVSMHTNNRHTKRFFCEQCLVVEK